MLADGKVRKPVVSARSRSDGRLGDVLPRGMAERRSLAGFEGGIEVRSRVVEASYFGVLIYLNPFLHFPGPGDMVFI